MKNLKVSQKLVLGFGIVALLGLMVGIVGVIGMYQINEADTVLYEEQTLPLPDIAKVLEYTQRLRVAGRDAIIHYDDPEKLTKIEANLKETERLFEYYLDAYDGTIKDSESRKAYDEAKLAYETIVKPAIHAVLEEAKGDTSFEVLIAHMAEAGAAANLMVEDFTTCLNNKVANGRTLIERNDTLYERLLLTIILCISVSIILSLWLTFYISGMISKPIAAISGFLTRFAKEGDFTMLEVDQQIYNSRNKDEIGQCQDSLMNVINRLNDVNEMLARVAAGDLTANVVLLSEKDSIGISIDTMRESLNVMFGEIKMASDQVSAGANQVSIAAQGLAAGSSEQAASVQEFTATLNELQEKTIHNAENSSKASDVTNLAAKKLQESICSMEHMLTAMKEIDESSGNIAKVIHVIEDIARQTNILALNAAVEAARAGQHGKSFAVVADEVRNLASKSAAAAKETAALIESSSERVKEGNEIVIKTSSDLEAVVTHATECTYLIEQVAQESSEQANSIEEINKGIEQISAVVQANSATAEQSAASSQEMAAQSVVLNDIVGKFRLKKLEGTREVPVISPVSQEKRPQFHAGFEQGIGKY